MFQCVLALSAERLVWIVDLSKQIGDVLARFCFGSPTSAAVCTYLYFTLLNALACGVQMGSWVTVSVWHIHAAGAVSPADCRLWPRECHCGKKTKLTNKWHSTRLKGPCSWSSSNLIVIIQHCVQWATKSWEGTRTVHIQGNDQEKNENDVLMTSRYFSYNSANENKQAEATAILEIEANQERNEEPLKLRTKFFTRRTARRSFTRICSTRWERGISLRSGLCLLFSVSVRSASWAVDLNSRQCKNDEKPSKNIQGLSLGAVAWHTI